MDKIDKQVMAALDAKMPLNMLRSELMHVSGASEAEWDEAVSQNYQVLESMSREDDKTPEEELREIEDDAQRSEFEGSLMQQAYRLADQALINLQKQNSDTASMDVHEIATLVGQDPAIRNADSRLRELAIRLVAKAIVVFVVYEEGEQEQAETALEEAALPSLDVTDDELLEVDVDKNLAPEIEVVRRCVYGALVETGRGN